MKHYDHDWREDCTGVTILMSVCYRCDHAAQVSQVRRLLAAGAQVGAVDDGGRTALMYACANMECDNNCRVATVQALIAVGARVNAVDKVGETALMKTSAVGKPWSDESTTRALLESGADKRLKNFEGKTALDIARNGMNTSKPNIIALLKGS